MDYQTTEICRKLVDDDYCSRGNNTISNNNYKMTRDDDKVEQSVLCEDAEAVESESKIKMNFEKTEEHADVTVAADVGNISSQTSDCATSFSIASTPRSVELKPRSLTFSIDRIMATGSDDVSRISRSRRGRSHQTPGQQGHPGQWTQSELSTAGVGQPRATSYLRRWQQEAKTRRHQRDSFLNWLPSTSLLSHVSPLFFYRQFQSSLVSSWLDVARQTSSSSTSNGSQHLQQRSELTRSGRPAWRSHLNRPRPGHSRISAGKFDFDVGQQNFTDWSLTESSPEYTASGALDLSCRSTIDHNPQSTSDTGPAFRKTNMMMKTHCGVKRWLPVVDLQNSLEDIVKEDVERPVKQISCPVCGKLFNAHYNLTRHMPVHTGARPYICKVCNHLPTASNYV